MAAVDDLYGETGLLRRRKCDGVVALDSDAVYGGFVVVAAFHDSAEEGSFGKTGGVKVGLTHEYARGSAGAEDVGAAEKD